MSGASVSWASRAAAAVENRLGQHASWTQAELVAAVANGIVACAIVYLFHDRFWWPPDDGAYAYVADRLRDGAVLNRDVQDIHAGYVHFLHALALEWFGRDILSLRYPLAILTVVQASIVFAVLRPLIGAAAICGGLAMSALTFVQFLNPTANWYALFLAVVLVAMLAARFERSLAGLAAIGFALASLFLFRQLSGVIVGMGVFAYLLLGNTGSRPASTSDCLIAKLLAAAMAFALAVYLWFKTDAAGFALYGAWPLAALLFVALRTRVDNAQAARTALAAMAGASLAFLPLVSYHLVHGSLGLWWSDAFASAISLTGLDFFQQASYAHLSILALRGVADLADPIAAINSAFWLLLLVAPIILGVGVVRTLLDRSTQLHPLPLIASFYALVSVHYAIPIYLLYSAGLTFAGLIALSRTPVSRATIGGATAFAVAVGLAFHAGQPLSRGLDGILRGERIALEAGLAGASIRMERADRATYQRLLKFIEANAGRDDPILALPMSPELYFLTGRNPPVRYPIAPLALRSERDLEQSMARLTAERPAAIVFKPHDKYTTARVRGLMDRLRPGYRLCAQVGEFELYAFGSCKP